MSQDKRKTAPPKAATPPPAAATNPAPATQAKPAHKKRDPKEDLRNTIFLVAFLTLGGASVSLIFGTWGLSNTADNASQVSKLGSGVISFVSLFAMIAVNLNQFAKVLEDRPSRGLGHYIETFLYYAVDWLMTFAGFGAWGMLFAIINGADLGTSIWLGILIGLSATGAGLSAYGTEWSAKKLILLIAEYNGVKPNLTEIQKVSYRTSGWISLFVSWCASSFGVIQISGFVSNSPYAPSPFTTWATAMIMPALLSGFEYLLLKQKNKSFGVVLALILFFSIDALTIFAGLGGVGIILEAFVGSVDAATMAIMITSVISKAFTAYLGAIGAETAHVDANNVDEIAVEEPANAESAHANSETHDAPPPATQTDPTSKTQAAPAAASPSSSTGKLSPPPQYTISPQQWEDLVNGETGIEPFWDRHLSPSWLAICDIDGKEPVLIGFVPFDWIPDEFLPTPPNGMSYPKEKVTDKLPKKKPEPTYHPVGMGAVNLDKMTTPPPPADQKSRYDA